MRERQRESFDKLNESRKAPTDINEGDIVLLLKRIHPSKLDQKYYGPFRVEEILRYGVYRCRSFETGQFVEVQREHMVKLEDADEKEIGTILEEDCSVFNRGGV